MFSVFEKSIREAVIPQNRNYGFMGTAGEEAGNMLSKAVALVKKANSGDKTFQMNDTVISHFLDSRGGRHLAELMLDKADNETIMRSLKKSINQFAKNYNPAYFREDINEILSEPVLEEGVDIRPYIRKDMRQLGINDF